MCNSIFMKRGEYVLNIPGGQLKYFVHNDIPERLEYLVVYFHGALVREKVTLPFYGATPMFKKLGIPAISFSDPVLELNDDITLGWFAGNDRYHTLQVEINSLLKNIASILKCSIVMYGGSGGGFAALTQQYLFGLESSNICIVCNPQTSILNYSDWHINNYMNTFEVKKNTIARLLMNMVLFMN